MRNWERSGSTSKWDGSPTLLCTLTCPFLCWLVCWSVCNIFLRYFHAPIVSLVATHLRLLCRRSRGRSRWRSPTWPPRGPHRWRRWQASYPPPPRPRRRWKRRSAQAGAGRSYHSRKHYLHWRRVGPTGPAAGARRPGQFLWLAAGARTPPPPWRGCWRRRRGSWPSWSGPRVAPSTLDSFLSSF